MICSQKTYEIKHDILPSIEFRSHQIFIEIPEPWERVYSLSPKIPKELIPTLQEFAKKYPSSSVSLFAPDSVYSDATRLRILFLRQLQEGSPYERAEFLIPYENLPQVLSKILFSKESLQENRVSITSERDYFVCTHTNRDACCGKFGNELYTALKADQNLQKQNIRIFKCSHIGGHRYAPTLLETPSLMCWGQLTPDSAKKILSRTGSLNSLVQHYRGSAALNSPYFQVAEREMMKRYGWDFFDCKELKYVLKDENEKSVVEVKGFNKIRFEIEKTDSILLRANCNEQKISPFPQYRVCS